MKNTGAGIVNRPVLPVSSIAKIFDRQSRTTAAAPPTEHEIDPARTKK